MALYRYIARETPTGTLTIGPELEEIRCHYCGEEASPQVCPGDHRSHYHGSVHIPDGGLVPVCNECIQRARDEWYRPTGR